MVAKRIKSTGEYQMTNSSPTPTSPFGFITDTPIHLGVYWPATACAAHSPISAPHRLPSERAQPQPATPHTHSHLRPACWLLNHKLDFGHARRAYSIVPPLPAQETVRSRPTLQLSPITSSAKDGNSSFCRPRRRRIGAPVSVNGDGARGAFTVAAITARETHSPITPRFLEPGSDHIKVPEHPITWP